MINYYKHELTISTKFILFYIFVFYYLFRVEHIKMHEKHKGHESMHMEMMFILVLTAIVGEIILISWKQWHFRSYQVPNS